MNAENLLPIDRAAINRENSLKSTGPTTDAGKKDLPSTPSVTGSPGMSSSCPPKISPLTNR
jgi:hypothetical protein